MKLLDELRLCIMALDSQKCLIWKNCWIMKMKTKILEG